MSPATPGGERHIDPVGSAAAASAAVLYGTSYVATAFALRAFTPLGAAATRGLLGVIALVVVLAAWRTPAAHPRSVAPGGWVRLAILGLLGGPVFIVAMNTAVSLSGATVTAFVAGLYAVLAAAFGIPLLGEAVERRTLAALGLALVGTALLANLQLEGDEVIGVLVGLGTAVAFALFLVLSRRWSSSYGLAGPLVGIATLGLTAATVGLLLPILGDPILDGPARTDAWAAVAWLAIGPGALAAVLVVVGMRRLPARRASMFLLLNPPTAALGGWLLLGERLSATQVAGAVAVLIAMAGSSGLAGRVTAGRRARSADERHHDGGQHDHQPDQHRGDAEL